MFNEFIIDDLVFCEFIINNLIYWIGLAIKNFTYL
jgi:hypothetical protein